MMLFMCLRKVWVTKTYPAAAEPAHRFAPLPKTLMVTFETFLAAAVLVNRRPSGRRFK